MSVHGADSKLIEEKLEQVGDLKAQIKCLLTDNEEVKMNQEELNANMATVTHQMTLLAEAVERVSGNGRADLFRRVSRISRQSFRRDLPSEMHQQQQRQKQLVTSSKSVSGSTSAKTLSSPLSLPASPLKRKASLEGIVKQLTSLAVSISTDDVNKSAATTASTPTSPLASPTSGFLSPPALERTRASTTTRRPSGSSLPGRLMADKKLRRTNIMKRRESQALLEGVRKLRGEGVGSSGRLAGSGNSLKEQSTGGGSQTQ